MKLLNKLQHIWDLSDLARVKDEKGFTLIELLVVIAIIGILAGILFIAINPKEQTDKAKIARTKLELKKIADAMYLAKASKGKRLIDITGNTWSEGSCTSGNEDSDDCKNAWKNVREKVSAINDWPGTNIMHFEKDPWGNPYGVDENEGETDDCAKKDIVRSFGPDGIIRSSDDIVIYVENSTPACQ